MKRFSEEEKRCVVAAVREHPVIWDKTIKEHSNRSAINSAWENVAGATGYTEDDCRTAWKSLRDSSRYHAKKRWLSGSSCDLEDEDVFWKYAEDMSFLVAPSSQRITYSTPQEPQERSTSSSMSQAEYSYPTKSSQGSALNALETSAEQMAKQMANQMSALVDMRRSEGEGEGLKYKELYGYVDVLLRKMPEDEAFLVGTEITALVQERVKKYLSKEK